MVTPTDIVLLAGGGLLAGVLAGFLGIGGGVLMVPLLIALGLNVDQATATSLLAILITASVGSFQNWRLGHLKAQPVLLLGFPAVLTVILGTAVGGWLPEAVRRGAFGLLLLINLYLSGLKRRAARQSESAMTQRPGLARLMTGGTAGFMAGLFGVGGGVIMVPLQMLLLGAPIKTAVRTSLGVIVITAAVACVYNASQGDVVTAAGVLLGLGGLLGVQFSTRFLPRLSDRVVSRLFQTLLIVLAIYMFWQSWQAAQSL
ncbi:MAG: sulfite exporter TauE/SafE family protein [Cyanobacteria bacterium J06648_16]